MYMIIVNYQRGAKRIRRVVVRQSGNPFSKFRTDFVKERIYGGDENET